MIDVMGGMSPFFSIIAVRYDISKVAVDKC